jgi:ADP-dependent NAD(P)H-hydrate dehydratase
MPRYNPSMANVTRVETVPPLPPRPADGHKGMFGRVLVVGGNKQMLGAPVLAGTAALRMGSGLVQIAVPRSILAAALSVTPELIGLALGKGTGARVLDDAAQKADAIVLGPGLGSSPVAAGRVGRLVRLEKPMVLDADALNVLSAGKRWPAGVKAHAVLTPHPGEMARLGKLIGRDKVPEDDEGRIDYAVAAATAFGQVIVLKGSRTVVTDAARVYVNHSGDSSLSKAGSGDVLSGILGCLLGQKLDRFEAACLAVHLHGRAGELAGRKLGMRCVLARDVIEAIPAALVAGQE